MILPDDLKRLPPQALDVIRYLGQQIDNGADIYDMMDAMGMSERGMRKWLRRLVTRYYTEMPVEGYYLLTEAGRHAAGILREFDTANPGAAALATAQAGDEDQYDDEGELAESAQGAAAALSPAPRAALRHIRRLMIATPKELVARSGALCKVGFDRPAHGQPVLGRAARAILRVSAPGCDVRPVERPLDVGPEGPAGPVQFEIIPRLDGSVRVKVEVFQLVTLRELVPVGGLYYDLRVASFPTPASGAFQALGAEVALHVSAS